MRILVTGGAGFIGSCFIRYFLQERPDYRITNLDKLTYSGNLENLTTVARHPRYKFVKGDIADASLVARLMRNCDVVVHFAAETHVDRSIKDGAAFIMTNVVGTHNLLEQARRAKVHRFVHVSTDEVYGSRKKGFFKETDILNPSSPYSASKAASDLLALSYHHTYKMDVVVTRCSNNFGPHQYPEKVIPLFVTNLLEGKKVPLYGKGLNVRDWIYVEDHCRGVELVMRKGRPGEIYNIAADNYLTNIELTRRIFKILGVGQDRIERVADRLGHDFRYAIDCTKINQLGFKPKHSLNDALTATVTWYQKNPRWWRKLKA